MAPPKRKRPHDHGEANISPGDDTTAAHLDPNAAPAHGTRRSTRHSTAATDESSRLVDRRDPADVTPPALADPNHESQSDPLLRTRRKRVEQDADSLEHGQTPQGSVAASARTTRNTRHSTAAPALQSTPAPAPEAPATARRVKGRTSAAASLDHSQPQRLADEAKANKPRPRPKPKKPKQPPSQKGTRPPSDKATATTLSTPKRSANSARQRPASPPSTPSSQRNIDKVVFGDLCFRAWYPSYYGKTALADPSAASAATVPSSKPNPIPVGAAPTSTSPSPAPALDRLYVCPCCFKYSRELVPWRAHVRHCESRPRPVPGRKVYTHPRTPKPGLATPAEANPVPTSPARQKQSKLAASDGARAEDQGDDCEGHTKGEWSVWEVDGERDVLFCQNLSLFAKLFLDTKSVFFDVKGFNYFLLVYTPPASSSPKTQPPVDEADDSTPDAQTHAPTQAPPVPSRPQIVGFFSKEKMSWDNNNLACILIFPPWQRKGLGALLMGVSYAISRRERVLGGPEKPISELGRRGYRRFWAGEVARWLLGLGREPTQASGDGVHRNKMKLDDPMAGDSGGGGGDGEGTPTLIVDVDECSRATWIVPEDCLLVLREMGIVEEGVSAVATAPSTSANTAVRDLRGGSQGTAAPPLPAAGSSATGDGAAAGAPHQQPSSTETPASPRAQPVDAASINLRIDKAAVRRWVVEQGISLKQTCDPAGLCDGGGSKRKHHHHHRQSVAAGEGDGGGAE